MARVAAKRPHDTQDSASQQRSILSNISVVQRMKIPAVKTLCGFGPATEPLLAILLLGIITNFTWRGRRLAKMAPILPTQLIAV